MEWLPLIAEKLRYPKFGHLASLSNDNQEFPTESMRVLQCSIMGTFAMFVLPNSFLELTPWGIKEHRFWSVSSEPENYFLYRAQLNEAYLRRPFTGIEMVSSKLVHIIIEQNRWNYTWEAEKNKTRLRKIREHLNVTDWNAYEVLRDDLIFVRDAFAHSFIDIKEIRYCGTELSDCFGSTHLGQTYDNHKNNAGKIFMNDVKFFLTPLINLFMEHQLSQIDHNKLFALCDSMIMPRTLGR